jgi:hypothetical protein
MAVESNPLRLLGRESSWIGGARFRHASAAGLKSSGEATRYPYTAVGLRTLTHVRSGQPTIEDSCGGEQESSFFCPSLSADRSEFIAGLAALQLPARRGLSDGPRANVSRCFGGTAAARSDYSVCRPQRTAWQALRIPVAGTLSFRERTAPIGISEHYHRPSSCRCWGVMQSRIGEATKSTEGTRREIRAIELFLRFLCFLWQFPCARKALRLPS